MLLTGAAAQDAPLNHYMMSKCAMVCRLYGLCCHKVSCVLVACKLLCQPPLTLAMKGMTPHHVLPSAENMAGRLCARWSEILFVAESWRLKHCRWETRYFLLDHKGLRDTSDQQSSSAAAPDSYR